MSQPTPGTVELARRARLEELWGWQWRWTLHALGAVQSRDRWPADQPWIISVGLPSWFMAQGLRCSATSPLQGAEEPYFSHNLPWTVGSLPAGTTSVTLGIAVGSWSGDWKVPVHMVKAAEDAVTAVTDPALDSAVQRALRVGINKDLNPATQTDLMVGGRLFRDRGPIPDDVAVAIIVELRRDDTPVQSWTLRFHDTPYGDPTDWIRFSSPDPAWHADDPADMSRWTVRVRGDASAALTDFNRTRFWAGQYTLPLAEVLSK